MFAKLCTPISSWWRRLAVPAVAVFAGIVTVAPTPAEAATPTPTKVVAGFYHSCALMSDRTVRCWGSNGDGQLGDGTTQSRQTPVTVSGLKDVVSLSAGGWHTCAVVAAGSLYCWGANRYGQLGDGTVTRRLKPINVTPSVPGRLDMGLVAAGTYHTCARTEMTLQSGWFYCWGRNNEGQLGLGDKTDRHVPVNVPRVGATALFPSELVYNIALGTNDTCVETRYSIVAFVGRLFLDDVWCVGRNAGLWGNGTTEGNSRWVNVLHGTVESNRVIAIGSGAHMCIKREVDDQVRCSGSNTAGQLGDGTKTDRTTRVTITGAFAKVTVGFAHTCGYEGRYHEYRCWGSNPGGQVGDGTKTNRSTPTPVLDYAGPNASIAAGSAHTCAIASDSQQHATVKCWGADTDGALGNGTAGARSVPTPVVGL
jgi:alpha-tubulin suppressor-like RCC1 family protein